MGRIAFIDLGSNSVRFVIQEIQENGSYQLIYQEKESIRLSEGMWVDNCLQEEAMKRAVKTLKAFQTMAEAMRCDTILAVATAAVRMAKNKDAFIDRIREESGIELHCISGELEARLGFLGVINTIALNDFVLFDLGGASVEITLVKNRKIEKAVSLPMGALTLTGTFQKGKEMTDEEHRTMVQHIHQVLGEQDWLQQIELPLIGIGGTARNLAKIDQRLHEYPITKLHNYELKTERIEEVYRLVRSKKLAQRRKISGLSAERADIIIAGITLVKELIHYAGGEVMRVSGCGLREGLFFDYYGKHYGDSTGIIPDILLHSAENVLRAYPQDDLKHAHYVAHLSNVLYEQWATLHQCPPRMKSILRAASLLHDIGKRINYYSHARHSGYMIVNSNIYGMSHREQAMAAFIATFSHGITSKLFKTSSYGKLLTEEDRETVKKMSIILGLAEAMDESHEQPAVSVTTEITDTTITITAWVRANCNINIADVAVDKIKAYVKKEFKRDLEIQWRLSL